MYDDDGLPCDARGGVQAERARVLYTPVFPVGQILDDQDGNPCTASDFDRTRDKCDNKGDSHGAQPSNTSDATVANSDLNLDTSDAINSVDRTLYSHNEGYSHGAQPSLSKGASPSRTDADAIKGKKSCVESLSIYSQGESLNTVSSEREGSQRTSCTVFDISRGPCSSQSYWDDSCTAEPASDRYPPPHGQSQHHPNRTTQRRCGNSCLACRASRACPMSAAAAACTCTPFFYVEKFAQKRRRLATKLICRVGNSPCPDAAVGLFESPMGVSPHAHESFCQRRLHSALRDSASSTNSRCGHFPDPFSVRPVSCALRECAPLDHSRMPFCESFADKRRRLSARLSCRVFHPSRPPDQPSSTSP